MSRILVDCDDVLIDLCCEWVKKLNEIYNTNYTTEDIPDWNFSGMFDVDKSELLKPLADKELWIKCKNIPYSIKYLKMLWDEGNEIYIVTATDYRNFSWKVEGCIEKYFPFIPKENIILCHNKKIILADYLIDDNIDNLININAKGILFSRPHNKQIDDQLLENNNIIRAKNWKDCYNIIKEHAVI